MKKQNKLSLTRAQALGQSQGQKVQVRGQLSTHDRAADQWLRGVHGQEMPCEKYVERTRAMNRIVLDPMDILKSNHNIPRRGRSMIIGASRAVPTVILLKNMIRHLLLWIMCTKNAFGTFGRVRRVWN